jgi:iron(III) transport system substrate-binding protein
MPARRLVLLSAAERRYCEPLLVAFAARHPDIEVEFVFGISTALHARYLAEVAAGGPTADLIWSSAMDLQMGLVLGGHAQAHGLRPDLPRGASFRDLAVSTTSEPLATLLRGPVAPAGSPAEISALLRADPARFHGGVVLPDIEANGLGFLAMLQWSLEAEGFDTLLDALAAAAPMPVGSAVALLDRMGQGASLALHVLGAYARRAVAADATLAIAPSAAPPQAVARVAFIPARAADAAAAATFLGFLVSPEGQAALGRAGLFPITAPGPAPIPIDAGFEALLDADMRARLLARWRAAMGRNAEGEGQPT